MRNRILISLFAWALCMLSVSAQDSRNTPVDMVVGDFVYVKKNVIGDLLSTATSALVVKQVYVQDESYIPVLREAFANTVNSLGRVKVIENAQSADGNAPVVLAEGKVSNISYRTDLPEKNSLKYVGATIECVIQLKDVATGKVISSSNFKKEGFGLSVAEAMSDATRGIAKRFYSYVNGCYPIYGPVLERGLVKKEKVKNVYIGIGSDLGVSVGQVYGVYLIKTVAGREAKTEIGKVKVTEVSGGDVSFCKVTKGGNKIQEAFEAGNQMTVVSEF